MQNAADFFFLGGGGGGYLIDVKIAHCCYIYNRHVLSLRAQISQNVKYWYEICDILVPIFHSVKFAV